MIKLYLPGATLLPLTVFLTGKGINSHFYSATFGPALTPGYIVELDEPDEDWESLRTSIVKGLAVALGIARIRVLFDTDDAAMRNDRLSARAFWVNTDGTQSEA